MTKRFAAMLIWALLPVGATAHEDQPDSKDVLQLELQTIKNQQLILLHLCHQHNEQQFCDMKEQVEANIESIEAGLRVLDAFDELLELSNKQSNQ